MIVIASNMTTRNSKIAQAIRLMRTDSEEAERAAAAVLQELARSCVCMGADVLEIDTQQHYDRPEVMEFAVRAVQAVTDCPLCLSTNSAGTLEAGLKACLRPVIVNYVSIDEARLRDTLPLAARHNAQIILLATDPSRPSDAEEMMRRTAVLVGVANHDYDIPNERILVDPGLLHITHDLGQRHFVEVIEFLRALPQAIDPPVRSTCWIRNASAMAPRRLRPAIEAAALTTLAAVGLSSAFIDVLSRDNMRTMNLIKVMRNETIYADRLLEV